MRGVVGKRFDAGEFQTEDDLNTPKSTMKARTELRQELHAIDHTLEARLR